MFCFALTIAQAKDMQLDSSFSISPVELLFAGICIFIIALGLFAFFGSMSKLKAADNPSRDRIVEYFRSVGATCAERAVDKKELPFYMTDSSADSLTFQAMEQKKILKRAKKMYYLDEDVLAHFIGGKR